MTLFNRWIHSYAVPTEGLALFRILFAGHTLLLGFPTFGWVSSLPPAFFSPPEFSLGAFFASMPSAFFLNALFVAEAVLVVALLFGYRTRLVSLLLAAVISVGLTFVYSQGKIQHGTTFFILTVLVMAFSRWGDAFSLDAVRRRDGGLQEPPSVAWANAWPVALMALAIAFGYFSAGFPKSLVWLDFDLNTHGARDWLSGRVQRGDQGVFGLWLFHNHTNALAWELTDLTAVAFEIGFLFAVLHFRLFRTFLVLAVVFHTANTFILGIDFTRLGFIYALFMPWERLLAGRWGERLRSAGAVFASPRLFLSVMVLVAVLALAVLPFEVRWFGLLNLPLSLILGEALRAVTTTITVVFGLLVGAAILRSLLVDLSVALRTRREAA
ncbi:MAG: hypothetical protein AAGI91_11540 [Bacteroidota bacterium]